jgi:hypothetical protein
MIHISSSVVLAQAGETINANNPRIGYHSVVTSTNVTASQEADGFPVANLANKATYLYWRGQNTSEQTITVALESAQEVNYFAIAKHNLGSTGATIAFETSEDGDSWDTVETIEPSSDYALICEFDTVTSQFFRLTITPGDEAPGIAVLNIGRLLHLQRRIYVGHTPFPLGGKPTVSNGMSENGQFLGRILRRESFGSSVSMQNITPSWYRTWMVPFVEATKTKPFFWAWRPGSYPQEVGYAWLTNPVDVSNARANGMMEMSFKMQGVR